MAKIFVATPMYGGQCTGVYVQSLLQMLNVFGNRGHQVSCAFMFNESLITRARCNMTHQFLKTDHDYLFWIDADIRFRAEDALRMLEADVDIIGGIYPKKEINWQQVRQAAVEGKENLQNYTGSFVVNLPPGQTSLTVRQDQPCEVMYVGTGFMLIKRHVFEKLKKYTPTFVSDMSVLAGEKIYAYYLDPVDKESGRLLSEDFYFCQQWIKRGGKIHAAPWCQLGHMGSYLFEGTLTPTQEPCDEPRIIHQPRGGRVGKEKTKDAVGSKDRSGGSKDNKLGRKSSSKDGDGDGQRRKPSVSSNSRSRK